MTECQEDSTETLFPRHPPHVGYLMTRIRLNYWKSKCILPICPCLQENISFQHRLFDCPTLHNQFQPLRDLFQGKTDKLRQLHLTSKDGPDGWRPLTLAVTLTHSSAVCPYLWGRSLPASSSARHANSLPHSQWQQNRINQPCSQHQNSQIQ